MGAWGTGLYSNDFSLDVRSAIQTISLLPFDEKRLTELAINTFCETANNQQDEDYTTFWLVLADQFHRLGLSEKLAFDTALDIINNGKDIQVHRDLGMSGKEIERRRCILSDLKRRLENPPLVKTRRVVKKPQSLIMSKGDVIVYPIDFQGRCVNPFFTRKVIAQNPSLKFEPKGWGAAVIIDCGRVFDYFSYYIPLVLMMQFPYDQKPTMEMIENTEVWKLEISGTCSKQHFIRYQFEIIGKVEIDERKFTSQFPIIDNGVFGAINNISIGNRLALDQRIYPGYKYLQKLNQITANHL